MVSDSGSEAEDVAMVVPVEVFSANDVAAKVLERLGPSLTSLTEITNNLFYDLQVRMYNLGKLKAYGISIPS